jgi:hypothetical protein
VDKEADRQRILIQITQNLSTRVKNSHAFDLPTIYIPNPDKKCAIPNSILGLCGEISQVLCCAAKTFFEACDIPRLLSFTVYACTRTHTPLME